LTAALHSWNHHVVEVTRAARPRGQSKNDTNDAVITRCLKRALTRRIYRILNTMPAIP
jgi:hypothetical protein